MLDDVGAAFPGDDTVLNMKFEAVFPDLGLGQFRADGRVNLRIGEVGSSHGWCGGAGYSRQRCLGSDSSRPNKGSRRRAVKRCIIDSEDPKM